MLAALAGAAAAGLGIAGWEIDDHLSGSGVSPAASQFKLPAVAPGKLAWKFSVGHPVASLAAAGNVVYVGIDANIVIAVNATTGRQLWRRATTSLENTNLVAAGGGVVAAGDKGPFALAAGTGEKLWSAATDSTPPLVAQGSVVYAGYAAKSDTTGGVTALAAATGDILWTYAFGAVADIAGGLAVSGGVVYTTASDGEIYALSAASGAKRQKVSGFGEFGAGTIAAVGGVVYAGLDDKKGTVVAVDVASGKTVWQLSLASSVYPPYVASAGGLVLASVITPNAPTGGVYGLDPATGKPKWLAKVQGTPAWGPAAGGDLVYVGSGADQGVLYAWDAATGKQRWSYTAPDTIGTGTVTAGSRVYVSAGQYVYSLGA
jgi:outer membrane protein assembly factor BamB